jgi:hypothetical protein
MHQELMRQDLMRQDLTHPKSGARDQERPMVN